MKFKDLKVGDEVYLVEYDARHRNPKYVKIGKIGKKYTYLETGQIIQEWSYDGYAIASGASHPYCKIYSSKKEYEEMLLWNKFKSKVDTFSNPPFNKEIRGKILDLAKEYLND